MLIGDETIHCSAQHISSKQLAIRAYHEVDQQLRDVQPQLSAGRQVARLGVKHLEHAVPRPLQHAVPVVLHLEKQPPVVDLDAQDDGARGRGADGLGN